MLKRVTMSLIVCILTVTFWACGTTSHALLTTDIGPPVFYENDNGDVFVARYGSLSDGSLHFARVTLPDGREYTLPQVVSASGARYTDEREIVWWTHQGTARVDVRDGEGTWKTGYWELREVRITRKAIR